MTRHCQKSCSKSLDCPSGLVCDAQRHFCKSPQTFQEIIDKQRCGEINKKKCSKDSDCGCNGGTYICDDHECVPKKVTKLAEEGEKCESSLACENVLECVKETCQMPAFTGDPLAFLRQQLLALQNDLQLGE